MKKYTMKQYLMFIVPSLLGAFLFLFPVKGEEGFNIPLGILINIIKDFISPFALELIYGVIFISFICAILTKIKVKPFSSNSFLKSIFETSNFQIVLRLVAVIISLCVIFEPNIPGAALIFDPSTGPVMYDLAKTLFATFLIVVFIIPLISDFGLMDFTGSMFRWFIHPLFKLPGRCAVDLVTSWVGGNASGILVTSRQYEQGQYTAREAIIISTMFSVVSLPFCLVIAQTLNVGHLFLPLYTILCIVGIITTIIMVRIPPLSTTPDTTHENSEYKNNEEEIAEGLNFFTAGLTKAIETANNSTSLSTMIKQGVKGALDLILNVIPSVIVIGTIGLVIAEKTAFFDIISYPFGIYFNLLGVEEAFAAAPTAVVGFADMFLPAIIGSSITSETTRVIIAILSLVQIVYLSEMASVLLSTKIPVKLPKLIAIFLIKTVLAIPLIVLFVNLFGL